MEHSKAPWTVQKCYSGNVHDGFLIADSDGWNVANLWHNQHTADKEYIAQREANANLIAAAPELLEACRYAIENLRPQGTITKDFSGHNAMATLSKAIAKAEGRG